MKYSLKNRISFWIMLLTCIVLLVSQVALNRLASNNLNQQILENVEIQLVQTEAYIESKMNSIIERLLFTKISNSFEAPLSAFLLDEEEIDINAVRGEIAHALSLYKVTESVISTIYLYTPKGNFTDMTVPTQEGYNFKKSALYMKLKNSSEPFVWGDVGYDRIFTTHRLVIPLAYKFHIPGYDEDLFLIASLNLERLSEYMNKINIAADSGLMLLNSTGTPLTKISNTDYSHFISLNKILINTTLRNDDDGHGLINTNGYWIGYQRLTAVPWHIIFIVSDDHMTRQLGDLNKSFFFVNTLVILIVLLFTSGIVDKFIKPLNQLSKTMEDVKNQNYDATFTYEEDDEIKILADNFNHMLHATKNLIQNQEHYIEQLQVEKENVRIEQLLKRRAELKALQAQINPHFLYNTLDSIRWKAEEIEAMEISEMTQSLATLFRIGLSRGRELIPIHQEINHVRNYLAIQRLRYGDLLNFAIDVDLDLDYNYCLKLILQPLVENSIYHGIKEKGDPGNIRVSCKRDGKHIVFLVEDDGIGIYDEKLHSLQKNLKRGLVVNKDGYGIFNVNERVRLYFGECYNIEIDSEFDKGTVVTIRVPIIEEKDVEDYVPYTNR